MSIWSELLFLHGHLTRPPETQGTAPVGDARSNVPYDAERLRALLGYRPAANRDPEFRGPLLGVRGLT